MLLSLFDDLKKILQTYLLPEQIGKIESAYQCAKNAHEGQARSSGEPYITHPIAVAIILANMKMDYETIMAALLHDVVEDTPISEVQIEQLFGSTVCKLVIGVTKLDKLQFRDHKEAQAENFRKMIMAMTSDVRVILIKLADRTHNMRTIGALRPDKRRRIAKETLEIFAPIANRLGINSIKSELQELGLEALYPMRYRVLKEAIKRARNNRKEIISSIIEDIKGRLDETDIVYEVLGREKNIYSIYQKMVKKDIQFHEIMDVYGFRIIVDNVDTCYRVLGQMHNLFKPRPGSFKDYIAIPKINGYQSLHTSLIGPHGVPIEIQIRTKDMDETAKRGIAAHWFYKLNGSEIANSSTQIHTQRWLNSLLELQQSASNSFEFIESVKTDLFPDEIYVFTPEGKIFELPTGATPVDFAYAVHSDIGQHCIGARVDHHPYPLNRSLKSGQSVEIVISPNAQPNALWLDSVVTSKARTKIRQFLKSLRIEECQLLGKRLLKKALGSTKLEDISEEKVNEVLVCFNKASLEDLYVDIALGNLFTVIVANKLLGKSMENLQKGSSSSNLLPSSIIGTGGLSYVFANCCRPIPGDRIIAHINPGKGLVIHTISCSNIKSKDLDKDKFLNVTWDYTNACNEVFEAGLRLEIINHQGILGEISNAVSLSSANIDAITSEEKEGKIYILNLVVTVRDRIHLADIIRKIKNVSNVIRVIRKRS
ncbi:MAG: bifunctional GTP diphosphokinase/guanosine-3',5'-bis pyrophosphate 3'-pyrophosphohydrolase [Succinivibrionaceae bacterium]